MKGRYYIIGDIHGHLLKIKNLISQIEGQIEAEDTIIFLGDYIDRGPASFEVIEFLIELSGRYNTVFLMGNHENMFIRFVTKGDNYNNYIYNGGGYTIKSYIFNLSEFNIPDAHKHFFNNLKMYYETDDFIAVHAGLRPGVSSLDQQKKYDMIWIREEFYLDPGRWEKTIIFGHTPTPYLHNSDSVYFDNARNIIGIDTCAMMEGSPLTCIRWPDKKIFQSS